MLGGSVCARGLWVLEQDAKRWFGAGPLGCGCFLLLLGRYTSIVMSAR